MNRDAMKFFNYKISLFLLLLATIFLFVSPNINEAGQTIKTSFDTINVYHLPEEPTLDDSLKVFIEFQNISGISTIRLSACSTDPFVCFYSDNMDYIENNIYEGIIDYQNVGFEAGDMLLYNFKIIYSDNSTNELPNKTTSKDYGNVVEPADNIFYFILTIGETEENQLINNNRDNTNKASSNIDIVLLGFAFSAGIVAFFSPCNYPMLPSFISYYLGRDNEDNIIGKNSMMKGLGVGTITTFGFFTVFGLVGLVISFVGNETIGMYYGAFSIIVGLILIILGFLMLTKQNLSLALPIKAPMKTGFLSFYLFGIAYAVASLACVFPVFIMLVFGTLSTQGFIQSFLIFILYTIGMAIPMISVAVAISSSKDIFLNRLNHIIPYVKKISAIILIFAGIYLVYLQYEFFFL
jgi:cytochrome c-type biogenesis protein